MSLTSCLMSIEESPSDSADVAASGHALAFKDERPLAPHLVPEGLFDHPIAWELAREPPSQYVALPKPSVTDWTGRSQTRVVVKFAEGSRVRLRGGQLAVDLAGASNELHAEDIGRLSRSGLTRATALSALSRVNDTITRTRGGAKIERLMPSTEAELEQLKTNGQKNTGRELGDMNLLYELEVQAGEAPALIDALNASDLVELAYPASDYPDPAQDIAPTTPTYLANQTYLDRSPPVPGLAGGVDARFAWTRPGGNGSNLRIIDVEQGWNIAHEDLGAGGNNTPVVSLRFNGCVNNGVAGNCPMGAPCHGTAAIGIVRGVNNAYGVTGIAHGAQYGISGVWATSACNSRSTAAAVTAAITGTNTQSGDVILIEQQTSGGKTCPGDGSNPCGGAACTSQYGAVPSESDLAEFMAIQTATANGRVVVAAAGNGEQNLDDPFYGGKFDRSVRDSGAIVVGAGSQTTQQPNCTSNAGSIVDVQGWGGGLRTLGYSDISLNGTDQNQWYSTGFGGTSGASAMIAGVATVWQSACKAGAIQGLCTTPGTTYPPYGYGIREFLQIFASPQPTPVTRKIGPLPNLRFALSQFEPPALGAVAAAKWTSTKNVVFANDSSGSMRMRTKDGAAAWTAPAAVPAGTLLFSPGAPIATGFPVSTELRVFSVGSNGQMRFSRSSSGGAFSNMAAIGAANAAPAYAHVATGLRNTNQLHVFWVNSSGNLMAYHATGTSTSFTGPTLIASNFAPAGAPLATGRQSTNQLDVFAIGSNGALRVAFATDGGSWQAPVDLTSASAAPAWNATTRTGGGVATGRQGTDQLDVFYVANSGIMRAMAVAGLGFWFGPVDLHTTAAFAAGSLISTANHGSSNNTLDVFARSTTNAIRFLRVVGLGSWSGPTTITNTTGQLIDSSFTAAANRSTNLLDVIAIGSNGISISTSANGGSFGTFAKLP